MNTTHAGVVQYWHTPFGRVQNSSLHANQKDVISMERDGSLRIHIASPHHSGLYYCLLLAGGQTTLTPYLLTASSSQDHAVEHRRVVRSILGGHAEERNVAVVSDGVFAAAVAASVVVTFLVGFSSGALSRTLLDRCVNWVRSLGQERRNHGETVSVAFRKDVEQEDEDYPASTTSVTMENVSPSPPAKPQRSFRGKHHEETAYLEGCYQGRGEEGRERGGEEGREGGGEEGRERGGEEGRERGGEEVRERRGEEGREVGGSTDGKEKSRRVGEEKRSDSEEGREGKEGRNESDREEGREGKEGRNESDREEGREGKEGRNESDREEGREGKEGRNESDREEGRRESEEGREGKEGRTECKETESDGKIEEGGFRGDSSSDSEEGSVGVREGEGGVERQGSAGEERCSPPRPARQSRVIRLYQYDEEGHRYSHLPNPVPMERTSPAPQAKQRSLSLTRLNTIMAAATASPMDPQNPLGRDSDPQDSDPEERDTASPASPSQGQERPVFQLEI
ncbi:cilia- and flagella-associated protein 251 isoform X2 [Oncorhynchus kisutch]|nr:cilia- and flagella-associated protein 251-like isoform X2 [Oncorhynchus kisutch]